MTTLERVEIDDAGRTVLEAWAKARGWLRSRPVWDHGSVDPWRVVIEGDEVHIHARGGKSWTLTPHVAWLWAHAVDTGREVRRRCPDCVKRGGSMEWFVSKIRYTEEGRHHADVGARFHTEGGWIASVVKWRPWLRVVASRPCSTCSTKGYLDTPLARVVCEGAPRECDPDFVDPDADDFVEIKSPDGTTKWAKAGDPTARTELLAAAYGLLVGWTDEQRAFKCEGCRPRAPSDDDLIRVCTSVGGCPSEPPGAARLRDHLEEHGIRVTPERTLAITPDLVESSFRKPHGVLGQALVLWLSGAPCEVCKGRGEIEPWLDEYALCPACHGHGTALAAYDDYRDRIREDHRLGRPGTLSAVTVQSGRDPGVLPRNATATR